MFPGPAEEKFAKLISGAVAPPPLLSPYSPVVFFSSGGGVRAFGSQRTPPILCPPQCTSNLQSRCLQALPVLALR